MDNGASTDGRTDGYSSSYIWWVRPFACSLSRERTISRTLPTEMMAHTVCFLPREKGRAFSPFIDIQAKSRPSELALVRRRPCQTESRTVGVSLVRVFWSKISRNFASDPEGPVRVLRRFRNWKGPRKCSTVDGQNRSSSKAKSALRDRE